MAYDFKNLNEVPTQAAPTENTTVMAFEDGEPKQIPALSIGKAESSTVFVIDTTAENYDQESTLYGNAVKEALLRGVTVWIFADGIYSAVAGFAIIENDENLQLAVRATAAVSTSATDGLCTNTSLNTDYIFNITA